MSRTTLTGGAACRESRLRSSRVASCADAQMCVSGKPFKVFLLSGVSSRHHKEVNSAHLVQDSSAEGRNRTIRAHRSLLARAEQLLPECRATETDHRTRSLGAVAVVVEGGARRSPLKSSARASRKARDAYPPGELGPSSTRRRTIGCVTAHRPSREKVRPNGRAVQKPRGRRAEPVQVDRRLRAVCWLVGKNCRRRSRTAKIASAEAGPSHWLLDTGDLRTLDP